MPRLLAAFALLVPSPWLVAQNPSEIMQQSVKVTNQDWAAAPDFDYCERDKDGDGSKTYAVTMLFVSRYKRLVSVNGHPLNAGEQNKEIEKFRDEAAHRKAEPKGQREQRIAQSLESRKRDHNFMQQLPNAFDFRLSGTKRLNNHETYVLQATPQPGYQPPSTETQALKGMEGTLWIDTKTFHWVKVQAEVKHPVSIRAFLAKVEPGTKFQLEKMPVAQDVWLPRHFSMHSSAKVLFFFSRKKSEDDTFFAYEKSRNEPYVKSCDADPIAR